jgi:hypothetical protein
MLPSAPQTEGGAARISKPIVTKRSAVGMMRPRFNLSMTKGKLMNKVQSLPLVLLFVCCSSLMIAGQSVGDEAKTIKSFYAASDFALTADPQSKEWKAIRGVVAERGPLGDVTPGHSTEIRSRWTKQNLYFLFVCHYEQLNLKPNPTTTAETNKLWDWDVAEAFIGTDFKDIKRYTEFQVSPQGEWVDLFIDRNPTPPNHDWQWNSGYAVKARVNEKEKVWYGEMRIPLAKIDTRTPQAGLEMRINFYRLQGPPPQRKGIAWQPTGNPNYHTPEAFGRLRLEK